MACNTLLNATEHFKKLNLLGELRSVSPEDYNTVEQEIKNLEKLFKEKYGIVDSFFNLKMVQTPTIARDGKFTNFRLDFNPQAFKKLDIAVVNYNAAYMAEHFKQGDQFTMFKPSDAQAHIDNVYKGDLYPSQQHKQVAIEQDNQDMAFMPVMTGVPLTNGFATNITNAISFKETLLKGINKRLGNAQVKRKTDKSLEIKKEIAKLNDLKAKIEKDINDLKDDPNLVDKMFSIFNKDIAIVSHLLNTGTPSIDNIHYAEDILSYFDVITDYSADNKDNHLVDVSDI